MLADVAALERASASLRDPQTREAAEAFLIEFRRSDDALATSRAALSEVSVSSDCQFHAVCALRESALRRWGTLEAGTRREVWEYAVRWTLERPDAAQYVRNQMSGTAATLVKRACVDASDEEKMAVISSVEAAVRGAAQSGGGADAARVGLEVFAAVVGEFAPGTASELGTTWERHERCRASAERHFLRPFFDYGCERARACVADGSVSDGRDRGTCAAALRLMNAVLSWDFNRDVSYGFRGRAFPSTDSAANAFVKLTPGIEWREVLLSPG